MTGRHPHDSQGRLLPHPGWPGDRQAPGDLELVRRFCNSVNRENGAERFDSPAAFDGWLATEGLVPANPTTAELERALEVRDVLHDLVVANATGIASQPAWHRLAALLAPAAMGFAADDDGVRIAASGDGTTAVLGRLGLAVAGAVADGTWPRLKACRNCHWVVYDPSKNRSSRWCSMSACGGRHNAREYRRRRRSTS